MERKVFFRTIVTGALAGTLIAYLEACQKTGTTPSAASADFTLDLSAAANASLRNAGGFIISNDVIVINNSGTYVALSDICTHRGCSLGYNNALKELECPCHGGTFALSGNVTSGPPDSSLKIYTISQSGNMLHVQG